MPRKWPHPGRWHSPQDLQMVPTCLDELHERSSWISCLDGLHCRSRLTSCAAMFIPSRVYAGWMTFSQRSPAASASEAAFRPGSACLRDTTLLHGTAAGIYGEATEKGPHNLRIWESHIWITLWDFDFRYGFAILKGLFYLMFRYF